MHGAGAAERHAATELRAGHAQAVAQHPKERSVAVDIDAVRATVDFDGERHGCFSPVWVPALCEELQEFGSVRTAIKAEGNGVFLAALGAIEFRSVGAVT